ncbi:MAG TPA: hypothetical protein VFS12_04015 [Terriglobia bacterium]|nr:hypothetical protein [Terriglobia bacterium]
MTIDNSSYPMRWPCGPLEVALRRRLTPTLPDLKASLLKWSAPASLELLRGTPINCLIVPWAAGLAEDEEQQRQLRPLLARARVLGLQVVGRVHPPADLKNAAIRGNAAGLSALALPSVPETVLALPVIEWADWDKVGRNNSSTAVALNDSVWPGIRGNAGGNRTVAVAGPTGIPWLDSNAWLIQWARQRCESKTLWLAFEPAQTESSRDAESYLLALADTESCGARWIVSLDDNFRSALDGHQTAALERWKQINAAIEFFRSRRAWNDLRPKAALGIAAMDSDAQAFMNGEILNLLGRRQLPFRILGKGPWKSEETQGLVAILCADVDLPSATQRAFLLEFAEQGGLLIVPNTWERPGGPLVYHDLEDAYSLHRVGSGRVALARESWQDPYRVAEEIHLLISRRNDLFRLGNGASMSVYCTGSSDGRMTLIHLVNFDRRASRSPVSLWVKQHFRAARLWKLGASESIALSAKPEQGGQELALPPFATYAAGELES